MIAQGRQLLRGSNMENDDYPKTTDDFVTKILGRNGREAWRVIYQGRRIADVEFPTEAQARAYLKSLQREPLP